MTNTDTCEAETLIRRAHSATEAMSWDPRLKEARVLLDAALSLVAAANATARPAPDAHLEADYEDRFGGE
jgi:hypothetical protein